MEAYGNTIPVKANGQTFLPSDCQMAKRQDLEMCIRDSIMDGKKTVREVLKEADPELKVVDFKRFTLRAE